MQGRRRCWRRRLINIEARQVEDPIREGMIEAASSILPFDAENKHLFGVDFESNKCKGYNVLYDVRQKARHNIKNNPGLHGLFWLVKRLDYIHMHKADLTVLDRDGHDPQIEVV
eukprot:scaffold130275_cov48-Attheya_sp.AAC.2